MPEINKESSTPIEGHVTAILNEKFDGKLTFEGTVQIGGEFTGEFSQRYLSDKRRFFVQLQVEADSIIIVVVWEIFLHDAVIMHPPAVFVAPLRES